MVPGTYAKRLEPFLSLDYRQQKSPARPDL